MMEKDKIFFGESGLTTTSANYVANLAKESYQELEKELEAIRFYDLDVELLDGTNRKPLKKGTTSVAFQEKLETISQAKSLIAWLREAIKAKERLIKKAENLTFDEIAKELNFELPKYPEREEESKPITEDEYWATKNIKERNRFYELQTECAVIGQFIHPRGTFATEREALLKAINDPYELKGSGRDGILYTKTPSVSIADVEKIFYELQNLHRSYQAELNKLKHECEVAIQDSVTQANKENTLKSERYAALYKEYSNKMEILKTKAEEYKAEKAREAYSLKIIIPDSLKPIFDKVYKLGK